MKRKALYSLVNVKDVDVERLGACRVGQSRVVGVDVSKREFIGCLYWPDRTFERPWSVRSPGQIGLFVEQLKVLAAGGSVVVAMESSGTYGDVLRQALTDAGLAVERVSAKAVKDHAETFDGVPSQHDGKDAAVIGELCSLGKGKAWPWRELPAADQALRYQVRKLDTAQRIKQMYCGKLEALLARHWPEVSELLSLSSATLVRALDHWGSPERLGADPEAPRVLAGFGRHWLTADKMARVIASARGTLGVRMNPWQVQELRDTAQAIQQQRRMIFGGKRALRQLARGQVAIQAQRPAVGLVTACVLWVCLGDVRNYASAGAYRKAMGLNLKEHSSGQHKGRLSLSKRGQRLPRKWLYFSALRWMRESRVKAWVQRKKQRDGGRGAKAVVGVMRRLALAAWHAGQGAIFDPGRLFPGIRAARVAGASASPAAKDSMKQASGPCAPGAKEVKRL